jgi:hypothetical protein
MIEETFASMEAAEARLAIDLGQDNFLELPDLALVIEALSDKVVVVLDAFKSGYECPQCKGTGKMRSTVVEGVLRTCDKCDGKGATIIIPQRARSIATTGVVVSIGPDVDKIKLHKRVICTPHSGVALPMKGNIEIKIYHQHEPLAYLHNLNTDGSRDEYMLDDHKRIIDLDVNKFVELDTPLPESQNI